MKRRLLVSTLVACVASQSLEARADDTASLEALLNENIVTTASTAAESASSAPATSVTITAQDMETYGLRSIAEAIQFLAVGLMPSDDLRSPDLGARGVLLPGDEGKHFLLLVNGHAENDPLYGAARFDQGAGIPIDIIDRIEVIIGPGSVLYGSNAMLGVINVITKLEKDYRGGHVVAEYEPGRSIRGSAGAGFGFKLFGEKAELTAAVSYYSRFGPELEFPDQPERRSALDGQPVQFRRGGPADGIWGGTVRNAYFTEAPMGHLRMRAGNFDVNLAASTYKTGIPYSYGAADVDFDDGKSYDLDRRVSLDVSHSATPSAFVQITSRAYADGFDHQSRVNRNGLEGCFHSAVGTCQYYTAGRARWIGLEERVSLNWLADSRLVTLVGVDGRMRWVSAKEDALDYDTGKPFASSTGLLDTTEWIVSPYVQQTYRPTGWLDLNAGARLDDQERFHPILSPRGAIAVKPLDRTTVKVVYSQAFRAPTWNEIEVTGYRQAEAPALQPEKVHSVETSIEQRFGTHRILFGAFHSWWDDLAEPELLSTAERSALEARGELPLTAVNVVQYRNVADLKDFGWNGSIDGTFVHGKLAYGLNVTEAYSRGNAGQGQLPLTAAPRVFGNARVSYAAGKLFPTTSLAVSYVARRLVDQAYHEGWANLPTAPPLAVLRATVGGPVPRVPGLSYRVIGSVTTTGTGAYVAGNVPSVGYRLPEPTLAPIDRYSVIFGLRYDFATGSSRSEGTP